ncbi:putative type IX sorting system protein PorV2 [Flavicella sediminum]|uniref:putative type IX sorting system protein PorV2 n=1 Tax=Flavicella sediminum TaxID=2585141 RepID=UPI001FB7CD36|nr:PorV/PorQ family protein [Flavicella sediminum]
MKKIIFILFIAFQMAHGQTARKYSNEFLNIGVDAAALGMSKSVTATTDDVNSIYWNPAGLAAVKVNEGALMHTTQFAGIGNYDYAAAAFVPEGAKDLVLAVALIRFGVDDILNTTALIDSDGRIDYNRISLFSAADYALNFAVAKKIKTIKNLQVGINAKIVRRTIGDFASSWGFGLDIGAQYKLGAWKLGLMLRDITTTFNYWTIDSEGLEAIQNAIPGQNQETPSTQEITLPKLHFGIARNFVLKNKKFNLLSELDLHVRFAETNDVFASSNMSATPSLGFQLDYSKFVFLRAGVGNFQYKNPFNDSSSSLTLEPNLGLGFAYKGIQIDYALSNIASSGNALYSNTFSLKFDFNFFKK